MTVRLARLALCAALSSLMMSGCGDDAPTTPFRHQTVAITPSGTFPGGRGATVRFTAAVVNSLGEAASLDGGALTPLYLDLPFLKPYL